MLSLQFLDCFVLIDSFLSLKWPLDLAHYVRIGPWSILFAFYNTPSNLISLLKKFSRTWVWHFITLKMQKYRDFGLLLFDFFVDQACGNISAFRCRCVKINYLKLSLMQCTSWYTHLMDYCRILFVVVVTYANTFQPFSADIY